MLSIGHAFAAVDDDVKATFDRFVAAQNAHDVSALRDVLLDSPNFLWVIRGVPIWGRDAALKRYETLYQGTWKLSPDTANLKVAICPDHVQHWAAGPTGVGRTISHESNVGEDSGGVAYCEHSAHPLAWANPRTGQVNRGRPYARPTRALSRRACGRWSRRLAWFVRQSS